MILLIQVFLQLIPKLVKLNWYLTRWKNLKNYWANKLRNLLKEYDHKRNELIKNNIDTFSAGEINEFIMGVDSFILLGIEENKNDLVHITLERRER